MARYVVGTGFGGTQQAMTTTYKTLAALTAATGATTLRKAWIYDILFGADGTPADNALVYKADRQTSVGTGTSATPSPIDTSDAAALITATVNHTAEPTGIGNILIEVPVNQRASYRWVAAPGGELVVPATNTTGIGFRAKSPTGYTGTVGCSLHFWE